MKKAQIWSIQQYGVFFFTTQILVALGEKKVYVVEPGMTTGWATHLARFYDRGLCIFMLIHEFASQARVLVSGATIEWTT